MIIPDELIEIIDGYTHLTKYIADAIFAELDDPAISLDKYTELCRWGDNKKWTFSADMFGNCGFNMGQIGCKLDGDVDVTCKLCVGITAPGKEIQLSINADMLDKLTWDGAFLTPFARSMRRELRYMCCSIYPDVTGIHKDPFDVMCDGAHAAIWTWFHGGDLPKPVIKHIFPRKFPRWRI